uniref:Uncharacterized protein n=1 Tax=Anguilla anguilla TaxID=7936 RepID=A0A0E9QWL6_ANGAN
MMANPIDFGHRFWAMAVLTEERPARDPAPSRKASYQASIKRFGCQCDRSLLEIEEHD